MFELPAASTATPAATSIVTVPSADGVIVAVYVAPLPDSVAVPPPTTTSFAANPVTLLPNTILTSKVEPVAGLLPL